MVDITAIIAAIITVLGSVVTAYVIPWLKTKMSKEKIDAIISVADVAVRCVEQLYATSAGAVKKEQAVAQVEAWLALYKISVKPEVVDEAIEAAVKTLKIELGA